MDIKERNKQIVSAYRDGTSVEIISEKYHLSKMAVYQVVHKMKEKETRYVQNEIYQALLSVCTERESSGITNALHRGGIMTLQQLTDASLEDIQKLHWIG